jgi:hypothetical protein
MDFDDKCKLKTKKIINNFLKSKKEAAQKLDGKNISKILKEID